MEFGLSILIGTVLRWVYDAIKRALKLSDTGAAWGVIAISLVLALLVNVITGGFAGIKFDPGNFESMLKALAAAFGLIFSTAQGWFSLTKKRS